MVRTVLLMVGMLAGLSSVVWYAVFPPLSINKSNTGQPVAVVNGVLISESRYLEQLDAVQVDRREPLTPEDRNHILDRMIDEELLVQNGLQLGLAGSERSVRSAIVNAVIESLLADVEARQLDKEILLDHYHKHLYRFTPEDSFSIQRLVFKNGDVDTAMDHASQARELLENGAAVDDVLASFATAGLARIPLPEGAMPLSEIRQYLGASTAQQIAELAGGSVTFPTVTQAGVEVLYVSNRLKGTALPFLEIKGVVEDDYRRELGEQALRDYLNLLRRQSRIVKAE